MVQQLEDPPPRCPQQVEALLGLGGTLGTTGARGQAGQGRQKSLQGNQPTIYLLVKRTPQATIYPPVNGTSCCSQRFAG